MAEKKAKKDVVDRFDVPWGRAAGMKVRDQNGKLVPPPPAEKKKPKKK